MPDPHTDAGGAARRADAAADKLLRSLWPGKSARGQNVELIRAALSHAAEAGRESGIEEAAQLCDNHVLLQVLADDIRALRALPARAPGEMDRSGG